MLVRFVCAGKPKRYSWDQLADAIVISDGLAIGTLGR